MYQEKLQKIGLSKNQADIYTTLISDGEQKGSELAKKIGISRQLTYKVLDELFDLDLIEKKKTTGASGTFLTTHPSKLETLLQQQEKEIKTAQQELSTTIDNLISDYNLVSGKPGVQFFEGKEGIKKVINDTLTSKTTIYTYADMETVNKYIKKINDEYVQKRDKLKINKKVLLVDSAYTHKLLKTYQQTNLDIKFVKNVSHFATVMQIYDQKVTYITLTKNKMIGIIIHDKNIYEMHQTLFKSMWKNA